MGEKTVSSVEPDGVGLEVVCFDPEEEVGLYLETEKAWLEHASLHFHVLGVIELAGAVPVAVVGNLMAKVLEVVSALYLQ